MKRAGEGGTETDSSTHVEATGKSLAILEYLKEQGPATLSETAAALDNSKSTVYRHLNTLDRAGYVTRGPEGYRIGLLYLDYGIHAQAEHPLYHAAKPKVDALAERVGEKVWCVVEENGYAVYIYLKSGNELYQTFTRVGYRGHMHAFSAGKCMLAHMPREDVDAILDRHGLPAYTDRTITDPERLLRELDEIREQGYALHLEEAVSGGNAISVPVLGEDDSPVGAICVAGPTHRLDEAYLREELSDVMLGSKNEIELSLKYEGDPRSADRRTRGP